jgi:hypothetical protein
MRLETENGTGLDDPSPFALRQALSALDGVTNSYASLTAADGSYIQAGGGPSEFTLEIREHKPDGSFRHLKANRDPADVANRFLEIGGSRVSVQAGQIVDLGTVVNSFLVFANSKAPDRDLRWDDITAMFA